MVKKLGLIFILIELYVMIIYFILNYKSSIKSNNILYFYINSFSSILLLLIISKIYLYYGIYNIKDYIYINNTLEYNILILILLFKIRNISFLFMDIKNI